MTKLEERAEKIRKLRGKSSGPRVRRCRREPERCASSRKSPTSQGTVDENLGPSVGDE